MLLTMGKPSTTHPMPYLWTISPRPRAEPAFTPLEFLRFQGSLMQKGHSLTKEVVWGSGQNCQWYHTIFFFTIVITVILNVTIEITLCLHLELIHPFSIVSPENYQKKKITPKHGAF